MLAITLDRDVEVSDDVREVRIQFHVAMFLFSKCQFLVDKWVLARALIFHFQTFKNGNIEED